MTGAVNTKILVVGDVMLDEYIYGCADRISPEAPCVVLNNCLPPKTSLGGAANVAFQLSRSNYDVSIWSCIGKDDTGSIIMSKLVDNGICNMIIQKDEIVTTRKTRYLTVNNQQLLRVDRDFQYTPIKEDYIALLHLIESGYFGAVILSDYDKGTLSEDLCTSIIQSCKISNTKSVVDIKYSSIDKFRGVTLIKGNQKEFGNLFRAYGLDKNAESEFNCLNFICKQLDCQYVVMTKGKDGMIGYSKADGAFNCPSINVAISDVTGAGDMVTAFIAMLLLEGNISFKDMLKISNLAAARKVAQAGTGLVLLSDLLMSNRKHSTISIINEVRGKRTVVFTNGCFDIIHAGHVALLEKAKQLGDILVVGLNSDASVRSIKGNNRPINKYIDRASVIAAFSCVDYIIQFEEDTPYEIITQLKPNILVKGADYTIDNIVGADYVKSYGGRVEIVPFYGSLSSSNILNLMKHE